MILERNKNLSSSPISIRDRHRKVAEIAVKISLAEKTGSYESIHQELLKKGFTGTEKTNTGLKSEIQEFGSLTRFF